MPISLVSRGLHPPQSPVGYAVGFQLTKPGGTAAYVDTLVLLSPALTGATPSETEHNYVAAAREQLAAEIDAFFAGRGSEVQLAPAEAATMPEEAERRLHVEDDGTRDPLKVPRWRVNSGDLSIGTFLPKPWKCHARRRQFLAGLPGPAARPPAGPFVTYGS